ncbi:condensation domain-containing protein [Streptacidiphilus sp. N1-12]|uniref:Condensation domain-containing protein n=2 Tax=Streptacidiphilus alkalitolerans TaxID=3342712 RepID=A0ABV6WA34_9ACTN
MTWGQRAIWKSIRWLDEGAHYFNIRRTVPLPDELTTDQVVAGLEALLSRHEALRTRFHESDEGWVQTVAASGTLPVELVAAPAGTAQEVAEELGRTLVGRTFRHAEEWPFRCALVLEQDRPAFAVLVFSHLGVDFWGVRELLQDLDLLLRGQAAEPPDWQPLDQARFETEGPGAARGAASVEYWRRTLLTVPPTVFPPVGDEGRPGRFVRLGMDSPATAVAATALAERCQVSTGTVLLAATAAVLGAYTGHGTVPLQLIAVNRHDGRSRRLVAAMAENALFALQVGEGDFDQAVKRAFLAGMNAYRHAAYDPLAVDQVLEQAKERSDGQLNLGCFFNDKRMQDRWEDLPATDGSTGALRALAEKTEVSFVGSWERQDAVFFVHTTYAPGSCLLYLMADTDLIPEPDIDRLLRCFESLLVDSADGPLALADFRAAAPHIGEDPR